MDKIAPCLWFDGKSLEAAQFYASVIPGSAVTKVVRAPVDTPGAKLGEVMLVEMTLAGRSFQALNGGPYDAFNNSISLSISCEDQAEVDRLWAALTADGGTPVVCGWLKDKYGLSWQIVPKRLLELIADPDPARARRAMEAMFKMAKIDIAAVEAAVAAG